MCIFILEARWKYIRRIILLKKKKLLNTGHFIYYVTLGKSPVSHLCQQVSFGYVTENPTQNGLN